MNCFVVKFKNRNASDTSNKYLAELYVKGPKFDIDLIATDQKVFSAHKYVACMFSGYLKDYICEFKPKGKACVPLSEVSSFVLKQVIDLFYNGQIMVGAEVKPHIVKALNFLKVANCVIQIPGQEKAPETPKNGPVPQMMRSQTSPGFATPKIPAQQIINHSTTMVQSQSQYQTQPAKRQRTQSMYVERPVHGIGMNPGPSPLQNSNGLPSRIGGVSISKTKVAPMSNPAAMALLQNSQLSISRVQKPIQQQNIAQATPNVGSLAFSKEVGASDLDEEYNDSMYNGNMLAA